MINITTIENELTYERFLSGIIRHDIANGLLTLGARLSLLRDSIEQSGDSNSLELADKADVEYERLISQTNLWKEYEGDGRVSWQLLENIEKCGQRAYSKSGVEIVCEEYLGKVKVFVSPLVSKVFETMIDNSIRHGKATKIWTSHYFSPEGDLVIVYEDNGSGISIKDKELIFSQGFGKNTGYGLFFAREILKITNIEIFEDGEPGKGVRFKITVPKDYYQKQ